MQAHIHIYTYQTVTTTRLQHVYTSTTTRLQQHVYNNTSTTRLHVYNNTSTTTRLQQVRLQHASDTHIKRLQQHLWMYMSYTLHPFCWVHSISADICTYRCIPEVLLSNIHHLYVLIITILYLKCCFRIYTKNRIVIINQDAYLKCCFRTYTIFMCL
jgi:hypothetical protein